MFFNYLFILLSFLIILITGQNIFGGCGIRPPIQLPLPCPPPIIPIPCPPPSPCPPTFCPPPIVCPPPLPPLPCPPPLPPPPPCPLPLPCTCPPQQIGGIISPIGGGYPIGGYPSNDCCCQCNTPCRYMRRVKTHGSQIFAAPNEDQTEEDSTCNSIKLKKAIQENIINDDPNISKREIQKVAEKKLFTKINVICAKGEFSYLAYTDTFCQASYGNITCYAYRSLGLESNNNNKIKK
ncbi:Ground-like domain-containing protein [Meloidogyne graminicola]|uniref:Ground-like domain-containing protein n=1 Tax=Meloidogyne graminicola TaxID=189291 RepID=A0A8S9ZXI1_9BILA|nr:Ground-like domain-containing protein [Meloidogyne graminicola]